MAKAGDKTFEILFVGVVAVGAYMLARRQARPPVAYDQFGQPIAPIYGAGALSPVYNSPYGSPYSSANTIPNILNAAGGFFESIASAGDGALLQPSLPLGQAGVDNPPPYY